MRIRWKAASSAGALSVGHYEVRVMKAGKVIKLVTVSAAARSRLVTGLARHATYTVSVRASNWAGWGTWSAGRGVHTR